MPARRSVEAGWGRLVLVVSTHTELAKSDRPLAQRGRRPVPDKGEVNDTATRRVGQGTKDGKMCAIDPSQESVSRILNDGAAKWNRAA